MKIRLAKSSDREEILRFCVNTFSWGDYINRVWDYWFQKGRLFVVEDEGKKVAMSHVALCPDNKSVWLEGIRVHPDYRRSRIATRLLAKMLEYGRKSGAQQASAIVDVTNNASQRMMEKSDFKVVSKWAYYSTRDKLLRKKSTARFAMISDLGEIWKYLQESEIYRLSARRYVKSWHWYPLDRKTLRSFVKQKSVIVTGKPIDGIALFNRNGYWDRKSVLQLVYLDSLSKNSLRQLVSFATNVYIDAGFRELQIVCYNNKIITSVIQKYMPKDEEQFLLYSRII